MCEPRSVAVPSPVLQGVAVAGVCRAREHRIPVRAQSMAPAEVRPARELEARKMVEEAPARLALESARPVVLGVVLTETAEEVI